MPAEAWLSHWLRPLLASAILLANYPPGSHCKSQDAFYAADSNLREIDSGIPGHTHLLFAVQRSL